ncbi:MAG: arsenic resistance protein [Thermaurantiacus sp.]
MTRATLERHQLWLYLAAILAGFALGVAAPAAAPAFEALLWPALALLLAATFTQVPLVELPAAFRDRRFITAVLVANFVAVPLLVAALLPLLPPDPAIRLGVVLVLLVPCTDWFITFTLFAGGDARRAIAVTPVNLLLQLLLLPFYVWLLLGGGLVAAIPPGPLLAAFLLLVALPLAGAYLLERRAARSSAAARLVERLGWAPVPLLALVLLLIAAAQAESVAAAVPFLRAVLLVFLLFLVGAIAIGLVTARLFRLPVASGRTLLFSVSTRNSFVVLPFALALPAGWEPAAIVIVLQSLVELFAMLLLLWLVPRALMRG